ncbi:hypothetical protein B7494_g6503 [Chlorociboria aeruginascens]|nr:hypothetical protein B7494_g6503 [Chlorociboria aeruginascens]
MGPNLLQGKAFGGLMTQLRLEIAMPKRPGKEWYGQSIGVSPQTFEELPKRHSIFDWGRDVGVVPGDGLLSDAASLAKGSPRWKDIDTAFAGGMPSQLQVASSIRPLILMMADDRTSA